jgi:ribosomal protein S24E
MEISHEKTGTPDRISLRESIINEFKSNKDNSYIIKLETDTGTNRSLCYAEIYDDVEYARNVLPKYIIERNFPPEKEEKPEKEIKEEKPKEEKKPEKPEPEKPVETTTDEKPKEEKLQAEPIEEARSEVEKPEEKGKEEKLKEETNSEKTVQPATEEKPKEETK